MSAERPLTREAYQAQLDHQVNRAVTLLRVHIEKQFPGKNELFEGMILTGHMLPTGIKRRDRAVLDPSDWKLAIQPMFATTDNRLVSIGDLVSEVDETQREESIQRIWKMPLSILHAVANQVATTESAALLHELMNMRPEKRTIEKQHRAGLDLGGDIVRLNMIKVAAMQGVAVYSTSRDGALIVNVPKDFHV
jgi:hypothetical protein